MMQRTEAAGYDYSTFFPLFILIHFVRTSAVPSL